MTVEIQEQAETPLSRHDYGVTPVEELTDRQLAEETLYWLREAGRTIAMMQHQGISGIVKAMMSKKG